MKIYRTKRPFVPYTIEVESENDHNLLTERLVGVSRFVIDADVASPIRASALDLIIFANSLKMDKPFKLNE